MFQYKIDIKTSSIYIEEIIEIIKNNHNYEIPEIVSLEIKILDNNYKKWFESNIRKE